MEYGLPLFFAGAMGLALLIYVVLDGYDLGIGLLLPFASETEKDMMIASIGPFWDANETWIVLGVGILLIAFPKAQGAILTALYIPITLMLMGLILRGIAFDFRVKAEEKHKSLWNTLFFAGSLIASCCQGWMLGTYITGLDNSTISYAFSLLIALTLPALYIVLGAAWLLIKTEGALFQRALGWANKALIPMAFGLIFVSIATPLVSSNIADRWFTLPNAIGLLPIPLSVALVFTAIAYLLQQGAYLARGNEWLIFTGLIIICTLATIGLAYSIYPDMIIGKITLWEAAAATESLTVIFWGTAITLPVIIGYTFYVYRVFSGKTTELRYDSNTIED